MDALTVYNIPVAKKRLGCPDKDGGHVVAVLGGSYDLFLSGGIADDVSFEQDFLSHFPGTEAYAFDGTIATLPNSTPGLTFVAKNIGAGVSKSLTNLAHYFKGKKNVFLKLDIEGGEFQIIPLLTKLGLMRCVKQLVLEIHSPQDIHRFPGYYGQALQSVQNADMFEMLKTLNTSHTLVHFHANNVHHGSYPDQILEGAVLPFVFEVTFVRNDCVVSKTPNTSALPTSLDRPNTPLFPDYHLDCWPYVSQPVSPSVSPNNSQRVSPSDYPLVSPSVSPLVSPSVSPLVSPSVSPIAAARVDKAVQDKDTQKNKNDAEGEVVQHDDDDQGNKEAYPDIVSEEL